MKYRLIAMGSRKKYKPFHYGIYSANIMALLNSEWVSRMRVDRPEVEFPGNQENDGSDSRQSAIAARFALGGLEQAVQGFEEAVGHAAACPGDDALEMGSDHPCDIFSSVRPSSA